jgi:hypothetical protein
VRRLSLCRARKAVLGMPGRISYATTFLPVPDVRARMPRKSQSTAARTLQDSLSAGIAPHVSSRSHSRAALTAAIGDANIAVLGIDIELIEQGRPFEALARFLVPDASADIGAREFYRCWTFAEAYFKAFQQLPPEKELNAIGKLPDADDRITLEDGTQVLLHLIASQFQLCLVWRSAREPTEIRYRPL